MDLHTQLNKQDYNRNIPFKKLSSRDYTRRSHQNRSASEGGSQYSVPVDHSQLSISDYDVVDCDMGIRVNKEVPYLRRSKPADQEYPFHVYDASLPPILLSQFQPLFCKLCSFQFGRKSVGKIHYDSKGHLRKLREFLVEYSEETGEPRHPLAGLSGCTKNDNKKEKSDNVNQPSRCDICRIDLNSSTQAESHFQGKTHLRKAAGEIPQSEEEIGIIDDELNEDRLDMEKFGLPLQFASKQDTVNEDLYCQLCDVLSSNKEQMRTHYWGQRHRKRVKSDISKPVQTDSSRQAFPQFYCNLCNISVTSQENFTDHLNGMKHRRKQNEGTTNSEFICKVCDITIHSLVVQKHLEGKKHRERLQFSGLNFLEDLPSSILSNEQQGTQGQKRKFEHDQDTAPASTSCDICHVSVTSESQLALHINGFKHQHALREMALQDNEKQTEEAHDDESSLGSFYCHRCDINLQSQGQLQIHMSGTKHWLNTKKNM